MRKKQTGWNRARQCLAIGSAALVLLLGGCASARNSTALPDGMTWEEFKEQYGWEKPATDPEPPTADATTEPEIPQESETPTNPETPSDPVEPTDSVTPSDPATPVNPSTPPESETPTDPGAPLSPETPPDPAVPPEPETPTDPSVPADPATPADPVTPPEPASRPDPIRETERQLILNTSTRVFHTNPKCSAAKRIKAENRAERKTTIAGVMEEGYRPCGYHNCAAAYRIGASTAS